MKSFFNFSRLKELSLTLTLFVSLSHTINAQQKENKTIHTPKQACTNAHKQIETWLQKIKIFFFDLCSKFVTVHLGLDCFLLEN